VRLVPERPTGWVDDEVLFYDDLVLVTRTAAWTAVEVPLVPYGFRSREDRLALGWKSTLALAALRTGDVHLKVVRRPFDATGWQRRTNEHVKEVAAPGDHWGDWLADQADAAESVQGSTKHVILLRRLGTRTSPAQWNSRLARGPIPVVAAAEVSHWHYLARQARELLARGGFAAQGADAPSMRWLRRHALSRGLVPPRDSVTGTRAWVRSQIADEFGDVTLTPLARGVKVDSPTGTTFTATLVASAFPVEALHPESPPWLAHLDWVGDWVEADLALRLVPPAKAKRDVVRRLRLAQDQRHDAAEAGTDLPLETEQMHGLARTMEAHIPAMRRPLVYGWARFHVDADSEEQLAYRVSRLVERYSDEDSPHIDLSLPTGMAQVDLLVEGVPGQPVRHKSWKQRWTADTVACGLPQAGSNLAHATGLYVGPTTGRYVQAVTLDPHHGITRRTNADIEGPGGMVLLGAQRAGKSSALGTIVQDATERGYTSILVDFSGPLARLADLPRNEGRMQVLNLTKTGGGILDPMSPAVIPGDARYDKGVREARKHLTRNTLHLLAHRHLAASPDAESAMLRAITEVAESDRPSLAAVLGRLAHGDGQAGALAEHLAFELGSQEADVIFGQGTTVEDQTFEEPVTRIITAPGLPLPAAGQPIDQWMPSQALGAAVFGIAAHLAHRLLWDLPPWQLKYLLVDEAHIAMGTEAGRRVIEQSLRDGPKHSVVVGLATHNAIDLSDERIVNALATKMLFRSTSDTELARAIAVAGLEDSPLLRKQIRGLRNGEAILVSDTDVRDRVQWHLFDSELRDALNTTGGVRR
jgi:hypothetical protein